MQSLNLNGVSIYFSKQNSFLNHAFSFVSNNFCGRRRRGGGLGGNGLGGGNGGAPAAAAAAAKIEKKGWMEVA